MKYCLPVCMSLMVGLAACASNVEEELYPDETCDTSQVTYTLTVAPIIEANCFACHGGPAIVSGIPLEGYDHIKPIAESGRLVGALRHQQGFSSMPKDAPALPECEILKIEKWVADGVPNN